MRRPRMVLLALVVAGASLTSLPACSTRAASVEVHMMPMDQLPAEMQSAPVDVRTAYQFAAANPQVSMNVRCYCGCDSLGHTSNFQCYVSRFEPGGVFVYDRHALGLRDLRRHHAGFHEVDEGRQGYCGDQSLCGLYLLET